MKKIFLSFYISMCFFTNSFAQSITATHSYDALHRLSSTAYSNGISISYTYDELGNRISKTVVAPITYTFTGNGNWDVPSNWLNNLIPPTTLPSGSTIVINPIVGGECVLNLPLQTILIGASFRVETGKKIRLPGNLIIN
jgi:YD repeat-containing protein